MPFLAIKHAHLTFVVITVVLFNLRYFLRVAKPERPLPAVLKIVPHINDTLLLITGLWAMGAAKWVPFGNADWLGVKLVLVVAYIMAGSIAMRAAPRTLKSSAGYLAGLACMAAVVYLAYYKPF
ncbi:SirB2 family protein [Neisseria canis]|uniref:Regulator n=1 Tax=Neisseria canis TaxID=493 RepID=A0A1X3D0K2_9NEIS|nr:SirB2 family protein [Neisseria canis]OSI13316.1 SirB family protein [Neisseria canis]VEF01892.1 Regulator [Neisseria canis]